MQRNTLKGRGSPSPRPAKNLEGETAKGTSIVYGEKVNRVPGDLLSRTIAARPPNEDRIRGIAA
jgi:hypothetical protein